MVIYNNSASLEKLPYHFMGGKLFRHEFDILATITILWVHFAWQLSILLNNWSFHFSLSLSYLHIVSKNTTPKFNEILHCNRISDKWCITFIWLFSAMVVYQSLSITNVWFPFQIRCKKKCTLSKYMLGLVWMTFHPLSNDLNT